MANIIYDKYNLGQSESREINTVAQEISIDLCLEPNTHELTFGKIYGQAVDSSNKPIKDALIDLMSPDYIPKVHTLTDCNGNYSFDNVKPASYTIFATAKGYKTEEGGTFNISKFQQIRKNFILRGEIEMSLGVIAGDLLEIKTNYPIEGAIISLFKGNNASENSLIAISYTNEYGQFTFRDLQKGDYVVQARALGYNSIIVDTAISMDGEIVPMKLMALINNIYQGTVSGIITDNNNYPISNADVILYRVNSKEEKSKGSFNTLMALDLEKSLDKEVEDLTPIAFTKTSKGGIYLFAHVPTGQFKVKANQLEVTTVTIE